MSLTFTITRENLLTAVHRAITVVQRSPDLPVLSHLLLRSENGSLTITGTDRELELAAVIATEDGEDGETTVPARKFFDLCRQLPAGTRIRAVLDGDRLVLRAGRGRYVLTTLSPDLFPEFDLGDGPTSTVFLPAARLRHMLGTVTYAMARNDARYYLNGLLLELAGDTVRAVASDGHRLAVDTWKLANAIQGEYRIILPRKAVEVLQRLLPDDDADLGLTLSSRAARFAMDGIRLSTRLVEARYPDWCQAVPDDEVARLTVDAKALNTAIARVNILSHPDHHGLRLEASDGVLRLQTSNPDQDQAEETLEVIQSAEVTEIGFNGAYLVEALGRLSGEIQFRFLSRGRNHIAAHLSSQEADSFHLVMPMRL